MERGSSLVMLLIAELVIWGAYVWPWYNQVNLPLGGLPMFYWWPLIMFPISSLLLLAYTFVSEKGKVNM
ncbi:MAG: DUF3311 domain-containing protein [Nitrososphaerales archaeon]